MASPKLMSAVNAKSTSKFEDLRHKQLNTTLIIFVLSTYLKGNILNILGSAKFIVKISFPCFFEF